MKATLQFLIVVACIVLSQVARAEGTVNFTTRVIIAGVDAPVFDEDGVTRLTGTAYRGQLYYASEPGGLLLPAGSPVPFRDAVAVETKNGYIIGPVVPLPGTRPGQRVDVVVRAWESAAGPTFEAAVAAGGKHGTSERVTLTAGGDVANPTVFPADLVGLRSFRLQRGSPPSFSIQPADISAPLATDTLLHAVAEGTPPLTFRWSKDGVWLDGANGADLPLQQLKLTDAGRYRLEVRNNFGTSLSREVTVSVIVPPEIAAQPLGGVVLAGSTVNLMVGVTGTPPIAYQWFFNGSALEGQTQPELALSNISPAKAGAYAVEVRNGAGIRRSADAAVVVHYSLTLKALNGGTAKATPAAVSYLPGTVVHLEATAKAGYGFAGWNGSVSGTATSLDVTLDSHKTIEAVFSPIAGTLLFANKSAIDAIDAAVSDTDGTTRLSGVNSLAQLYAGPTPGSLEPIEEPVPFRTDPAGYISPRIVVAHNVAPGASAYVQMRAWDATGGATYEAALGSGSKAGESVVLYLATGGAGNPPSFPSPLVGLKPFSLQSGQAPVITVPPTSLTVVAGQPAALSVGASGRPTPQFTWFRNGIAIKGANGSLLNLAEAKPADAGSYYVNVSNPLGQVDSGVVDLIVLVPPTITSEPDDQTIFAGTSARLEVAAVGSEPVHFAWYEGPRGDTSKPVGGDNRRFESGSLLAGRTYWIRASNTAGHADSRLAVVTVVRRPQTLTFEAPVARSFGDPAFAPTAVSSSGLPVSFAVVSGPAVIADGKVKLLGAGEIRLRAIQAGDAVYEPAPSVERVFSVAKATASIALSNLDQIFDGEPKSVKAATTPTGLGVAILYDGKSAAPTDAGEHTVEAAIQDSNYIGNATAKLTIRSIANIMGFVFVDQDADGVHAESENGLSDVEVKLTSVDGSQVLATTKTALNGSYQFLGVKNGAYNVVETDPAGYASTMANTRTINVSSGIRNDVDFGDLPAATIAGRVFEDADGNGVADRDEPGLAGVTITLTGEGLTRHATTDAEGQFAFTGLGVGSYTLDQTQPAGFVSTTPDTRQVNLSLGGSASVSFGEQAVGTVTGFVFEDLDGNGLQDAGERGLGAVAITLNGGGANRNRLTSGDGQFIFAGVAPGSYDLSETDPSGFASTTSNLRKITLASGGAAIVSFGDHAPGSVSGVVFEDVNGDGQRNQAEPGLGGVQVKLSGSGPTVSATTSSDGTYSFAGVSPGAYLVEEVDPTGFASTTPNTRPVTMVSGASVTVSFGDQPAGVIAGQVFDDLNGDGTLDAGEPGLGGVRIALRGGAIERSEVTASDGAFAFRALPPGSYEITETNPSGFASSTPDSRIVNLAAGAAASALFGDQAFQTIGGAVFEDYNGNGQQDAGEPGIGGVEVLLLSTQSGQTVQTTATTPSGLFSFTDVPPGSYTIRQAVPTGYTVATSASAPKLHGQPQPSGPTGSAFAEQSLMLGDRDSAGLSFPNYFSGAISGTVFGDLDGDGEMDPAEDGLGGVVVELFLQGTSTLKRSVTTTGGGAFVMAGLTAGSYEVRQTPVAGHLLAVPARLVNLAANGAAVANFANQPAGVVSGRVFNDVNGNRVQDREEVGIGGVRVTLTDLATSAAASVVTSTDGAYVFGNIGRGDYRVTETDPKGFLSTTPNSVEFSLAVGGSRAASFADSTDRYASWAAGHGLLAGQSGTGDDPDRDGLANLVEFALGLDPKKASATTQAQARMVQMNGSRYPALEFVRSKDAVGAEFELATSTDLLNWTVVPAAIEAQQDLGPDTERVRLRGTSPLGPQKAQFYLLRVKRAAQ